MLVFATGIRVQIKPLRKMIGISNQSDKTDGIAAWIASVRRSYSVSRSGSRHNSRLDESSSLSLLDSDFFVADKFKVDQVLLRKTSSIITITNKPFTCHTQLFSFSTTYLIIPPLAYVLFMYC